MINKRFVYSVSGYRFAPESFRAFKGLADSEPQEINLSDEERHTVGYLYLTEGCRGAINFVKRIERKRAKGERQYITYGFRVVEDPRAYIYSHQLFCFKDAPINDRLHVFHAIKGQLQQTCGKFEQSTEAVLDGKYKVIEKRQKLLTADFNRPIIVYFT